MELLQWAGSCAMRAGPGDSPRCHAWPLRSLFCLQLLRFISATPHMPPSGFQSEKFLIKQDFQTRRFCQLFHVSTLLLKKQAEVPACCNTSPAPLQTPPPPAPTTRPKSHLSSSPASPCSSLHPQRPPQEISTTVGFAYGCPLLAHHVKPS